MASIIVLTGSQKGDYYPLGQRPNVIGRDESLMIQILDDLISRRHMQIRFEKEKNHYVALDMKSKHGVFINERKINGESVLVEGDSIRIGQTSLLFTDNDFTDRESAISHFKKVGERSRPTQIQ